MQWRDINLLFIGVNAGEEDSGSPATEDDDVGPDHRPVPQHRPGCDPPVLKGPLWGPLEGKLYLHMKQGSLFFLFF